eukprot:4320340-Prymnesium_polylepis.1
MPASAAKPDASIGFRTRGLDRDSWIVPPRVSRGGPSVLIGQPPSISGRPVSTVKGKPSSSFGGCIAAGGAWCKPVPPAAVCIFSSFRFSPREQARIFRSSRDASR